ncbi:hypothetical protein [Paeniglutamicibacter sp.]|uniref:hypothetical protein n=1 Tax=Paeniglutamicibacter sp. TaxID=1934391 RepID=UPI003989E27A
MIKGKRTYAVAVGLCCVGLMLGACTQGPASAGGAVSERSAEVPISPEVDAAAELAKRRTQVVDPAWSVKMKVLDRPQVAKGVVVVLSEGAKGLELAGLKETTGKKIWGVTVDPGWVPSGVNMGVNLSKTAKGKDVALSCRSRNRVTAGAATSGQSPLPWTSRPAKSSIRAPSK